MSKVPPPTPPKLKRIPPPPKKEFYDVEEVFKLTNGVTPPQAIDLEVLVLGAMLIDKQAVSDVIHILSPEVFFKREHEYIFRAIKNLYDKGEGIDIKLVSVELQRTGFLDMSGGSHYIVKLASKISSSAHIEFHTRIILEKFILRELITNASDVIDKAYMKDPDVLDLLDIVESGAETIKHIAVKKNTDSGEGDAKQELMDKVASVKIGEPPGVYTGIAEFDDWCGGFQRRELITVAARPGMGKLQPLTEPVLTPSGWKLMGDINKGSKVLCPVSGNPIKVLEVFPQQNLNIFKVSFNDGTHTECCNEHLFKIQTYTDVTKNKFRVVDVDWMINNGIHDTRGKNKFRIPLTNPVEFNKKEVPIHPYLLGLLISEKSREGFISDLYLYNSIEVRKDLLAGLMDSEGSFVTYKNKKRVSYNTTSILLKDNIIELIRSLGGKASVTSESREKCWSINLRMPFNPFYLNYKKEKFDSVGYTQIFTKTITSIEFLRKDKGQCILVDSKEHLYITRDYTVTHNTSAVLAILAKGAFEKEIPLAFISLEMTTTDLKARLASRGTKIPYEKIRQGKLEWVELEEVMKYYDFIDASKLYLVDKMNVHEKICAEIRKLVKEKGIKMVAIDYVQLMKKARKSSDRTSDLNDITRDLKALANELNVPIIIIAQLSRAVDQRPSKRPMLSDLKQSGSIEEDSDTVIFLLRSAYYEAESGVELPQELLGKTEMIVAKGRNTGTRNFWTYLDFINYDFRSL